MRIRKRLNIAVIVLALVFFVGSALAYNGVEGGILSANETNLAPNQFRPVEAFVDNEDSNASITVLDDGRIRLEVVFDFSARSDSSERFNVIVENTTNLYLPISVSVLGNDLPGWLKQEQGVIFTSSQLMGLNNGNIYVPPYGFATVWIEFSITEYIINFVEGHTLDVIHTVDMRVVPFGQGVTQPGGQPPAYPPVIVPPGGGIVGGGGIGGGIGGGAFFPPTQAATPPDAPYVPVAPGTPYEPVLDVEPPLPPIVVAEAVVDDPPTPAVAAPEPAPPVVVTEADVDAAAEAETDGLIAIEDPEIPLAIMDFEPAEEAEEELIAIAAPQIPLVVGGLAPADSPFTLHWWMFLPLLSIPFLLYYNRNVAIALHTGMDKGPIYVYIRRGGKIEIPESLKKAGIGASGWYRSKKFDDKALWDFDKRVMLRKNLYLRP